MSYDVVVVGSGAGGLTGALRAAERGLRVLLLEKADVIGGTAALTGGGLWAPGNQYLDGDDVGAAATYLDHTVGNRTPASMRQAFLDGAAPTIGWLGERGIRFAWMPGFPDYHPSEPGGLLNGRAINPKPVSAEAAAALQHPIRAKLPCGDGGPVIRAIDPKQRLWGGQALVAQLLLACEAEGVEIWTSSPFLELLVEDDRALGVRAMHNGFELEIPAAAGVLLAAGGFEHNTTLRGTWQDGSVSHGTWSLGVAGNTGDALIAGMQAGAATDLLEDSWWTPGFIRPDGGVSFLLWERLAPLGFVVDQRGHRWGNEGQPYNEFGHGMLAAEAVPSWQVFDQRGLDLYGFGGLAAGDDPSAWVRAGALVRADSVTELAEVIRAPGLVETAARWQLLAERGVDEDFGRGAEGSYERQSLMVFQHYPGVMNEGHAWPNPSLAPLGEGPYYAAKVVLSDLGTKGGLVCDESGRVTRPDGSTIPGLYACGNTMASVMGHAYPGPGSCITPGMTFARLAVDDMVER
jgi:3-oxosteroid 1-dehydrogenase